MSMRNKTGTVSKTAIIRVFNYPLEKVWKAWSDPEVFTRWWGPKNFISKFAQTDFRVGGRYLWNMHGPDGKDYYSAGVFKEIEPMKKIVYTDNFADEKGKVMPASYYGLTGEWPPELAATVTFEEMNGKTKMMIDEPGVPEEMREPSRQGMNESLDKLDEALK